MSDRPDPESFYWPSPTIWFVFWAIILSGVVVYITAYALGIDFDTFALTPVLGVAGACGYLSVLWLASRRDPRLWLDPQMFRRIIHDAYPNWRAEPEDYRLLDRLRAVAWRDGTLTIAQHAGIAAAISAATPAVFAVRWLLAVLILLGVFAATRWVVQTLLATRDRDAMQAMLDRL